MSEYLMINNVDHVHTKKCTGCMLTNPINDKGLPQFIFLTKSLLPSIHYSIFPPCWLLFSGTISLTLHQTIRSLIYVLQDKCIHNQYVGMGLCFPIFFSCSFSAVFLDQFQYRTFMQIHFGILNHCHTLPVRLVHPFATICLI